MTPEEETGRLIILTSDEWVNLSGKVLQLYSPLFWALMAPWLSSQDEWDGQLKTEEVHWYWAHWDTAKTESLVKMYTKRSEELEQVGAERSDVLGSSWGNVSNDKIKQWYLYPQSFW